MNFFQKLFGYRSKLAASSSLSFGEALDVATWGCSHLTTPARDVSWMQIANTNSMVPSLDNNAVVLLEKVPFTALREGDIVTYLRDGIKIIHRLNNPSGKGWQTIGDGLTAMDPGIVTADNFDRRVCAIIYSAKNAETDR